MSKPTDTGERVEVAVAQMETDSATYRAMNVLMGNVLGDIAAAATDEVVARHPDTYREKPARLQLQYAIADRIGVALAAAIAPTLMQLHGIASERLKAGSPTPVPPVPSSDSVN